ncbi:glycosyltransferase sugar-binding region DXD domain-containing protein-containing protein [Lineolata rhizophorae]|uniref:Glycosyltransferase sugar-binding region DXD domain-containing protein-containing protein n=1 Tax=Lineolata rhizophorae TaxID=578093 RepID=A0A6A6NQF0_9PEZI|nr:glycosyltransferase sugar-binding region DXD domain-containing protein-containing protein [Lineolata rhizophorae]
MLTFRRAIVFALAALALLLLLRSSHSTAPAPIKDAPQAAAGAKSQPGASATPGAAAVAPSPDTKPPKPPKPPKTQLPLNELQQLPLRKQLEYEFPYDPESKFPAYIWQTWRYTPASGQFEEGFREMEASWTVLHPTFVHEVITDSVAVHLIKHLYSAIPDVVEAYLALPLPVLKADFFRYLILLARGGIYADIDTAALKSAIEWIPPEVPRDTYGLVIGIEADPDRPDWAEWYSRRIQFCQWTIQAKPGHPVLRDVVANITEAALTRKAENRLGRSAIKSIVEFTGPAVWTDCVFRYFNDPDYFDVSSSAGNITWEQFTGITSPKKVGDVVVLPITSFSPGVKQMGAGEDDDPMAFVKHGFVGTWKPEAERHIGEQ